MFVLQPARRFAHKFIEDVIIDFCESEILKIEHDLIYMNKKQSLIAIIC